MVGIPYHTIPYHTIPYHTIPYHTGHSLLSHCFFLSFFSYQLTEAEKGSGTAELLNYNAALSMPFLFVMMLVLGEANVLSETLEAGVVTAGGQLPFVALTALCSLLGVVLNYALFLCTLYNSALATTVVGVLKGVVATLLGFFFLGGVPFHVVNLAGITMNMVGGVWYTVIKYQEKKRRQGEVLAKGHGRGGEKEGLLPNWENKVEGGKEGGQMGLVGHRRPIHMRTDTVGGGTIV